MVSPCVLIVDDNELMRSALRRYFRRHGFEVFDCCALDDAIRVATTVQPDLVLLDVRFEGPFRTGIDTVGDFIEAAPRCQVVVMTGLPNDYDERRALDAGALAYVMKNEVEIALATSFARDTTLEARRERRAARGASPSKTARRASS